MENGFVEFWAKRTTRGRNFDEIMDIRQLAAHSEVSRMFSQATHSQATAALDHAVADTATTSQGVELVLPTAADDSALDTQALRLLGIAQRRTWGRRRDMMARRSMDNVAILADPLSPIELAKPVVADLLSAETWDARLQVLRAGVNAVAAPGGHSIVVRTRGWDTTEPGVLVDSRAVTGAVFDVAIMVSSAVEEFRRGEQPFVFLIPEPDDAAAAKLWRELISLVEDRLGIDRGTVRYSSHVVASKA